MSQALERARELLLIEARAIECAAGKLGPSFAEALNLIHQVVERKGKLILLGVGKSQYIAHKLAASFMSTGVTALFVHPAEALHGDLGSIWEGDVCILFSKSGSTAEILSLIPFLKGRNPLIAITGEMESALARQADVVLDAGVEKEACPINMLPTASTTVALALGDALLATYADQVGFTKQNFAAYHPGGSIGKRLHGRVLDVYHPVARVAVGPANTTVQEAARLMGEKSLGAFCVVDGQGILLGLLTDGDLRRAFARGQDSEAHVSTLMNQDPITVRPEMLIDDAIALMEQKNKRINCSPVLESGRLLGLVHIHDLI